MGITTKKLSELLAYMDSEQMQLPEIQRDFVWRRKSIKLLFDSLYRDLPIGQMLVWKPTDVFASGAFHRKKLPHSAGRIESFYGYLLDGQQRLTAISRVREDDEEYPLTFDLDIDLKEDEGRFYWDRRRNDSSPWSLPVTEALDKNFKISEHLDRLKEDEWWKDKYTEQVINMLKRLQGILDREISVVEFESNDYKLATELFIRFNSTGKKLNKNDLALAELAQRVPGLTQKEMRDVLKQWSPKFQFTRPFLIQCLAAVHTGRMRLTKPEEVWGDSTPAQIKHSWAKTARGLDSLVQFLTGTVRWESGVWIPSFNALIPLVYVLAHDGGFDHAEGQVARKWLLLAGVRAYFSGSAHTDLDQVLRKLKEKTKVDYLWVITRKKLRKLKADDFQIARRSGPTMAAFISLLRNADARDWVFRTPLDGSVIGRNTGLQVHHFFPRALLSKHSYAPVDIDTFANYTVIRADTNLDVSMEEPATYLQRIKFSEEDLEKQCIPPDKQLWQLSRYDDFLSERAKLLAKGLNGFLGLD